MMTLVHFLYGFLDGIRKFVGLVIPLFSEAADFQKWPKWLKVLIGAILFTLACVFLYGIQPSIPLGGQKFQDWLINARCPEWLRRPFLVVAFCLLVAIFWVAGALYKMLLQSDDDVEFADIKEAWQVAVARLRRDGYPPTDLPLYLVLGRPVAGLDRLFLASGASEITRTPGDPKGGASSHPLRVYAWDQAVFVTCPGASGWGQFCHKLSFGDDDAPLEATADGGAKPTNPYVTISFSGGGGVGGLDPLANQRFQELTRKATEAGLSADEKAEHRELYEAANAAAAQKRAITLGEDDRERHLRRLKYLCRLIRDERRPWCPLNGLLVLVPWAATESDDTSRNAAGVLAGELAGVREELRQRYPTFAMVTDLEDAEGFQEFRGGFLPEMLKQRLGQKLPLVPEFSANYKPAQSPAELVNVAVRWIGLSVVPAFILRFLSLESRDPRQTQASVALHNRKLYTLMRAVFERGPRLGTILADGVPKAGGADDLGALPLFGGCYLTATGESNKQQAFVPGAFAKLVETQDKVSWAPEAVAEDTWLSRLALAGWAVTAVLGLGVLAGIGRLAKVI